MLNVPPIANFLLATSIFFWIGPRFFWSQSWRRVSQVSVAALPTCAETQSAARSWAAELRGSSGEASIEVRTSFWKSQLREDRAEKVWDFLPPVWATSSVRSYGISADASGWDGTKRLYNVSPLSLPTRQCVIYSFGSNLQTEFEVAMLEATVCDVYTFDCTVELTAMSAKVTAANPSVGDRGRRFFFRPYCVGVEGKSVTMNIGGGGPSFTTVLRSVPSIMAELGHTSVELLKMDVESSEHVALAEMIKSVLPPQISFEIHQVSAYVGPTFEIVAALIDQGYVPISRDDNLVVRGCCSELTFILGCNGIYST